MQRASWRATVGSGSGSGHSVPLSSRQRLQLHSSSSLWRRASEEVQKLASTESLLTLPIDNSLMHIPEHDAFQEEE